MRFISNKVRDAFFDQRYPKQMPYNDETGDAGDVFVRTLSSEQLRLFDDFMKALYFLRQEERKWYFQRGWLSAEKAHRSGKTP